MRRLNFIHSGQVATNVARSHEFVRTHDSFTHSHGCSMPVVRGHRAPCGERLPANRGHRFRWSQRRLPPVPLQTVALEPEQQVGSAVTATGLPRLRPCSNAADSARPRGKDLGSKGNQIGIEHCRRRHIECPAPIGPHVRDRVAAIRPKRYRRGPKYSSVAGSAHLRRADLWPEHESGRWPCSTPR